MGIEESARGGEDLSIAHRWTGDPPTSAEIYVQTRLWQMRRWSVAKNERKYGQ